MPDRVLVETKTNITMENQLCHDNELLVNTFCRQDKITIKECLIN